MEQIIFDAILAEIRPTLSENGFSENDGVFTGETRAFKIGYNDEAKLFELYSAEVAEGNTGEFSVASSYLFDDASTVSDASAVGIDFNDTVTSLLGINIRKMRSASAVALPTRSNSDTPGMDDLCSKLLAIFPQYKDAYKDHMAEHGEFLYVTFLFDTVAVEIRKLLESGSDKKLKKIYDALNDLYVKGDRNVGNAIVVVVLGGALKGDAALTEKMLAGLSEFQYLKVAVRNISARTNKDKKLKELYGI